ncbi:MAG: hypothetical protein Q7I97_07785 [Thermovirgaceae bacterium]|nr:hypothetical protein [Thermovirgaceae bacterium]
MPHLIALTGSGSTQRRLLSDCIVELKGKGFESFERFSGESWQDLLDISRTGGLFEDRRAVVVEAADALGPLPEEFFGEVTGAGSSVVYLLVFDEDPSKTLPAVLGGRISIRKPPKIPYWVDSRVQWLEREARSRRIKATPGALYLLAECVEDPEEMSGELDKLGLASGGAVVDEDLVKALTVDEGGRQMLALLDGICRGDTAAVIEALSSLRRRDEPLKILSALHKRMRIAMYLSKAQGDLRKAAETALDITQYQGKTGLEAARIFPPVAIRDFVLGMARESASGKSGLGSGWNGVELEIFRLLASRRI